VTNEQIRKEGEQLWTRWTAMWNGETAIAEAIIADGFWAHLTAEVIADPEQLRDGRAVAGWVGSFRRGFDELVYTTGAGPFVDIAQRTIACPWFAAGIYGGRSGRPQDIAGAPLRKAGLDVLKFRDGRVEECWTLSGDITKLGRERF
jgi:hypothetical protein